MRAEPESLNAQFERAYYNRRLPDEANKFNRSEYLRVMPPSDPDYIRVYRMRADTESLNKQFERAFYNRRLPGWGLHNQTAIVLMVAIAQNAWARHTWQQEIDRQQAPPHILVLDLPASHPQLQLAQQHPLSDHRHQDTS